MPIYSYKCQACEDQIEKRQSFSDAPLTTCEACGGELRKVLFPAGIVFKGSGFYNTDYRGNGAAKTPDLATNGTAKSESTADSGTPASTEKSDSSTSTSSTSTTKSEPAAAASTSTST